MVSPRTQWTTLALVLVPGRGYRGRWRCSHRVHHIFTRSSSQSGTSTTRAAGP